MKHHFNKITTWYIFIYTVIILLVFAVIPVALVFTDNAPEPQGEQTELKHLNTNEKISEYYPGLTQPFPTDVAGVRHFRIPAMVTLADGRIISADARWNNALYDGFGLDTLVSLSIDNGKSWSTRFANYFEDNGDISDQTSTAFVDPALLTDGKTVYLLTTFFPHSTYIKNLTSGTGYNKEGQLMLSVDQGLTYQYHLGEFNSDGYAQIFNENNLEVKDYYVDSFYYLYFKNQKITNLFFKTSPFQVVPTSYLWLTKSVDGGITWDNYPPVILNKFVKRKNEEFYGVGPGRGIVTSTGRMIFCCYSHSNEAGSKEKTSIIYSDDQGITWKRSQNMEQESSEATIIEINNILYLFPRYGGYYYSMDDEATWSDKQEITDVSWNNAVEINALVYSQPIDDNKPLFLLSAPTTEDFTAGAFFLGTVDEDGLILWLGQYDIVGIDFYRYSCISELSDGTIAALYEEGKNPHRIRFQKFDINEILKARTLDDATTEDSSQIVA